MTSDRFALSETQHRDTEALLTLAARTGEEPDVREACEALTRHAEVEEQVLSPRVPSAQRAQRIHGVHTPRTLM
jgi:hypothetical protein